MIGSSCTPARHEKGAAPGRGSGERAWHPVLGQVRHSRWHGAVSWALVSRSRAVPAGGRRSKPSPRFFAIGGTPFRGPAGRGAGLKTGVPARTAPSGWLEYPWDLLFHRNCPEAGISSRLRLLPSGGEGQRRAVAAGMDEIQDEATFGVPVG